MHTPVLLKEVVEMLDAAPGKKIIDATYGEGGHTRELLVHGAKVLAIDRDKKQLEFHHLHQNLTLKQGNFKDIEALAREADMIPADGYVDIVCSDTEVRSELRRGIC